VQLADGIHNCELIRADWTLVRNNGVTGHAVNTLCIEPERNLRDYLLDTNRVVPYNLLSGLLSSFRVSLFNRILGVLYHCWVE